MLNRRLLSASALAGAAMALAATSSAEAQSVMFRIPAEAADAGIKEFARQAGRQFLVRADVVSGKRTAPVQGVMSVHDALDRLLLGTGLAVVGDDGRTITLADNAPVLTAAGWSPGGAAVLAAGAAAVDPPPAGAAPAESGEIIVTGTRSTSRTVVSSMSPIDVLSAKTLEKTGKQSTRDVISTLVPSANTSNSGAGASFAFKTLSLRGLSADQTLLLVNGKRWHDTAVLFVNGTTQNGQSPPDLDLIPADSISHIEVLRDGASAQYGSDALAGVINIITKTGSHGGDLDAMGGATSEGDGATGQVMADVGTSLPNDGYFNLSGEYHYNNLADRGAITPNETQLYYPLNAAGQPVPVGTPGSTPDPREATADRHTSHPGAPSETLYSLLYSADQPMQALDFYSTGSFAYRKTAAWLTFRDPDAVNNNIAVYPDGYSPKLFLNDLSFQGLVGVKGNAGLGIKWDLSSSFGEDHVRYDEDSLNASLGPDSPKYFYLGTLVGQEWTTNLDLSKNLDTGLFAQPLLIAGGAEYRKNWFTIEAGQPASYINGTYAAPPGDPLYGKVLAGGAQGVTGFPPFAAGTFSRDNVSVYLDLEQALTRQWDLSAAGRYEHYSDFGSAGTWKLSTRYEIIPGLAIRGTANTGFRAPSLQQEHYASSSTIGVVVPPATTTQLYPVQLLPPDNPAAIALGAKPLKPETSMNYSVGLVAQPVSRMNITVDVYQIKITNRILQSSTLGPSATISAALASQGLNPQQAVFYYGNFADTTTQGVDIVADYVTDFGRWGQVTWTASANFTDSKFDSIVQSTIPGIVYLQRNQIGDFTVGTPRNKEIFSADWSKGPFEANLRLTRYGTIVQVSTLASLDAPIEPKVITDLDLTYHINGAVAISVGANNLFNIYPTPVPVGDRGTPPFTYYNQYAPYGITGGFYYTRLTARF